MKTDPIDHDSKLQRFLVILADSTRCGIEEIDGHPLKWLFATTANVLAENEDEAMIEAAERLTDEDFAPVLALSIPRLNDMLVTLKTCPLTASNPLIFNDGSHEKVDEVSSDLLAEAAMLMHKKTD